MPPAKKKTSRRTLIITAAILGAAVVAYIYWKKRQAATATPAPQYVSDTTNAPAQSYIPAAGGGATQLGQGVGAPPPVTCSDGSIPDPATGACPGGGGGGGGGGGSGTPPGQWEYHCNTNNAPGIVPPGQCDWTWVEPPNASGGCDFGQLFYGACRSLSGPTGAPPPPNSSSSSTGSNSASSVSPASSAAQHAVSAVPASPGLLNPPAQSSDALRLETPRLQAATQAAGRGDNSSALLASIGAGPFSGTWQPGPVISPSPSPPGFPPQPGGDTTAPRHVPSPPYREPKPTTTGA
jgi:hypothetical protein